MSVSGSLSGQDFQSRLAFGQLAETAIARWLLLKGKLILPVYDAEYATGKGPRLFGAGESLVAPDMLTYSAKGFCWVEAKHKSVFTWHRKTGRWVTGIDSHHWKQYLLVREKVAVPLWLLFLHEKPHPDSRDLPYCQGASPVGLFGGEILDLAKRINHTHANWGRHGMTYWSHSALTLLASLADVITAK